MHLVPCDAPKLGLALPKIPDLPDLVAVPLVLTMGWKNSPPAFSTVTETIADMFNERLRTGVEPLLYALDNEAEKVVPLGLDKDKFVSLPPPASPLPTSHPDTPSSPPADSASMASSAPETAPDALDGENIWVGGRRASSLLHRCAC